MAPQRVAPSAVFDTPPKRSLVRSKLKTISEDRGLTILVVEVAVLTQYKGTTQ